MTNDATRATATAMPDEIETLGARLGAAMHREEDLQTKAGDARIRKNGTDETYFEAASSHASDEYYALREMVSLAKARTLAGAAIQIAEASNLIAGIWDQFPKDKETFELKKDMRAIDRLLYSALDLVDRLADQPLAKTVHPVFGSPYLNPWIPVDERLADVEGRATGREQCE